MTTKKKRGKKSHLLAAGDLVNVWIEVEQADGRTITDAVHGLNTATGRKYTLSRVSEWRRGSDKQRPDDAVKRYMMGRILAPALIAAGVKPPKGEAFDILLDRLTLQTTH